MGLLAFQKMEPNELIQVMNDFLTLCLNKLCCTAEQSINIWGRYDDILERAPFDPEHERSACFAALSMKKP